MVATEPVERTDPPFLFLGGRVSLDLTCTYGTDRGPGDERLRGSADLHRWIVEAGLTGGRFTVTDAQVDDARKLRRAIDRAAQAVIAEREIAGQDGRDIANAAALPPLNPRLSAKGTALTWSASDKTSASLSTVARDALDLFTGPWRHRVRACADPTCGVLFVDTSRPGSRQWCSSDICGSRTRARRYRSRRPTR